MCAYLRRHCLVLWHGAPMVSFPTGEKQQGGKKKRRGLECVCPCGGKGEEKEPEGDVEIEPAPQIKLLHSFCHSFCRKKWICYRTGY